MSKQKKSIIAALIALVVLVGAFALVVLLKPEEEAPSSSGYTIEGLASYGSDDVTGVTIENETGTYTITVNEDGTKTINELKDYPQNRLNVSTVTTAFSSITASEVVYEEAPSLAEFGLEPAKAKVSISYNDGNTLTLCVGSKVPSTEDFYYVCREGEKKVYLIDGGTVGQAFSPVTDYVSKTIVGSYLEDDSVTRVDLVELGGTVRDYELVIEKNPLYLEKENELLVDFEYYVTAPQRAPVNTTKATFLDTFFGVNATSVVALDAEKNLAKYGLDEPFSTLHFTAKVEDTNGIQPVDITVALGDKTEDGTGYYAIANDTNVVYTIAADAVPWAEVEYHDMLSALRVFPDIATVSELNVMINGKEYNFDIEANRDADDKLVLDVTCGSTKVDENLFRKLYSFMLGVFGENPTFDEPTGDPVCTLEFVYRDTEKGAEVINLYDAGPRLVYVEVNGYTDFTMRSAFLDRALDVCEKALAGESFVTDW